MQEYNAQIVVSQDQIIVAAEVSQDANDKHQLQPMLHQAQANLRAAGVADPIGAAVADAGYWNANEIREVSQGGVELFVATTNDRPKRQGLKEAPSPATEALLGAP